MTIRSSDPVLTKSWPKCYTPASANLTFTPALERLQAQTAIPSRISNSRTSVDTRAWAGSSPSALASQNGIHLSRSEPWLAFASPQGFAGDASTVSPGRSNIVKELGLSRRITCIMRTGLSRSTSALMPVT
jgi:hypothetical protein